MGGHKGWGVGLVHLSNNLLIQGFWLVPDHCSINWYTMPILLMNIASQYLLCAPQNWVSNLEGMEEGTRVGFPITTWWILSLLLYAFLIADLFIQYFTTRRAHFHPRQLPRWSPASCCTEFWYGWSHFCGPKWIINHFRWRSWGLSVSMMEDKWTDY